MRKHGFRILTTCLRYELEDVIGATIRIRPFATMQARAQWTAEPDAAKRAGMTWLYHCAKDDTVRAFRFGPRGGIMLLNAEQTDSAMARILQ